jgi:chaperonin GroEL
VGATTEIEMLEKKERIDDAINAVRAAMRNGVIAGGGVLLNYYGADSNDDLIMTAFSAPMRTIAENAGIELGITMHTEQGLDARTGEFADMISVGIIDPVDIIINSIRSAVSIAKLVLLSDALVALPCS